MKIRHLTTLLLSGTILTLTGCSNGNDEGGAQPAAQRAPSSTSLMPEDDELATLYRQSCYSCHATGAGGAPRTGSADWDARMAKGMEVLMDNTINGFRGMPPLGMCMDCSEEEFESLIRFMANAQR